MKNKNDDNGTNEANLKMLQIIDKDEFPDAYIERLMAQIGAPQSEKQAIALNQRMGIGKAKDQKPRKGLKSPSGGKDQSAKTGAAIEKFIYGRSDAISQAIKAGGPAILECSFLFDNEGQFIGVEMSCNNIFSTGPLTAKEVSLYVKCKRAIRANFDGVSKVAEALLTIKRKRLNRRTSGTLGKPGQA